MSHNNSICKFRNYSRDSSFGPNDFSTKYPLYLFYREPPSPAFRGAEEAARRAARRSPHRQRPRDTCTAACRQQRGHRQRLRRHRQLSQRHTTAAGHKRQSREYRQPRAHRRQTRGTKEAITGAQEATTIGHTRQPPQHIRGNRGIFRFEFPAFFITLRHILAKAIVFG